MEQLEGINAKSTDFAKYGFTHTHTHTCTHMHAHTQTHTPKELLLHQKNIYCSSRDFTAAGSQFVSDFDFWFFYFFTLIFLFFIFLFLIFNFWFWFLFFDFLFFYFWFLIFLVIGILELTGQKNSVRGVCYTRFFLSVKKIRCVSLEKNVQTTYDNCYSTGGVCETVLFFWNTRKVAF